MHESDEKFDEKTQSVHLHMEAGNWKRELVKEDKIYLPAPLSSLLNTLQHICLICAEQNVFPDLFFSTVSPSLVLNLDLLLENYSFK